METRFAATLALLVLLIPGAVSADESWDGTLLTYGKMREAIGQHLDQGRVRLGDLQQRPHLYAVAALEGLRGEITIFNGMIFATGVDANGTTPSHLQRQTVNLKRHCSPGHTSPPGTSRS